MSVLSGVSDFFGLDIGTTAIRVVQLKGSGAVKAIYRYGQVASDNTMIASDAKVDTAKLTETIKQLVKDTGITSKNVAVSVPSNRVFTAVIDMDRMSPVELDKTMRYQADSLIPTPLAESKVDWVVLGDSPKDKTKVEVLLSSVPNEYIEARLDLLEAAGLEVIAIEPDSMALARAIIPNDSPAPMMAVDMGYLTTDIVVTIAGTPRVSRAVPFGSQMLVKAVAQSLAIDASQAQQYVFKFGLSKDKLDGQVYNVVMASLDSLMSEIDKSLKFFQERYTNAKLERIIVTGGASAIPEFPLYVANKYGLNVEIGNAWRNVSYPPEMQNELVSVSNHFAVAAGLAERSV